MKIAIKAEPRSVQGTGASRRLRRESKVPGVVYGAGKDATPIQLDHKELWFKLKTEAFHASILDMEIGNDKSQVLLRDYQMHPFRPLILHADFQRVAAEVGAGLDGPCNAAWSETQPDSSPDCVVAIPERPSVALVGDSHAWALGPGVRALAARQNLGFRMLTKPGCPPLLGVSVRSEEHPVMTRACPAFMENAVRAIVADRSIEVVVLTGLWDNPMDRYFDYVTPGSSRSARPDSCRSGAPPTGWPLQLRRCCARARSRRSSSHTSPRS